MSSDNFLNAKLSFPLRKLNLQHNLSCFYTDKVTCDTDTATRSKTKKLTCSLETMKFCHSMLRVTLAVPTQTFFQAANQYIFGPKNPFALPPKDCALLHVDFLSH